nr:MAG TPA: hypothetical protein [Caudoviricetes sp.]
MQSFSVFPQKAGMTKKTRSRRRRTGQQHTHF